METALSEITLVLFTTIAPAGIAGYAAMVLFTMMAAPAAAGAAGRYLVIPLTLVISGLIASATHLGTPANALYVLTGVGRSPLSNEVVAVVVFLVFGGVHWMASFRDDVEEKLRRTGSVLAIVAGLMALGAISLAYRVDTVPTWSLPFGPVTLWLNALATGPAVGLFGLMCAGLVPSVRFVRILAVVGVVAAVANGMVLLGEWVALGAVSTTVASAAHLVPHLPAVAVAFALAGVAGNLTCAFVLNRCVLSRRGDAPSLKATPDPALANNGLATAAASDNPWTIGQRTAVLLCGLAMLAGCFAVRFCFYAMYMTAGI